MKNGGAAAVSPPPKSQIKLKADYPPNRLFLYSLRQPFKRLAPPLLLGLTAILIGGCHGLPPPDRAALDLALPATYSLDAIATEKRDRWWEDFADSSLNELVHLALSENLSLEGYRARLARAQAQAVKAGANLQPALTGELTAGGGRRHDQLADRTFGTETYAAGLVASYEVDLWGRLAAQRHSATLAASASHADLKAAAMTIAAETARRWVQIISQQEQKKLLAAQLNTNQTYLDLVELRFRQSQASAIDVLQQQQLLESAHAQLPLVDLQQRLLTQELALLAGHWPPPTLDLETSKLPLLPDLPATGLPAQLLENRPDLQGALYLLTRADQELLVARADLLPALNLSARAGFDSDQVRSLFDNWLANLLASLTAPLLDGGRRRAEVSIAEANIREQLATYRQLVLTALQEVEGALTRETLLAEHLQSLEKQLRISRRALDEARSRYLNGLTDYLPVLTQLRTVQALEKEMLLRREEKILARISLHRALGGSWTDQLFALPSAKEPEEDTSRNDGPT